MAGLGFFDALKRRVAAVRSQAQRVDLQVVGLGAEDLRVLRPVFDKLGERLAVRFELGERKGDVLLVDAEFAARSQAQLSRLMRGNLPMVLVSGIDAGEARALSVAAAFERLQQELLRQLREIPAVRNRSTRWSASGWPPEVSAQDEPASTSRPRPDSVAPSDFDSDLDARQLQDAPLDENHRQFILHVLRGLHDERTPALAASYGPNAHLYFDFRHRMARIDPLALQGLRVKRSLPQIVTGTGPSPDALSHELDEIVWDLGMACGRHALMNCPDEFWHAPLLSVAASQVERYSRQPRHLAVARRLVAGPATPAQLRRHVNISVEDLRRFIQAGLFLGLLRWTV